MENFSSPSFINLLNSSNTSSDPNDPNLQHQRNFHPHHYSMNYPPQQMPPNFPGYPHNFNPFGGQSSYQHCSSTPASYNGGPNMGNYPQEVLGGFATNGPSSAIGSMAFFGASGGSSSRANESSMIASASLVSGAQLGSPVIQIAGESESSSDDNEKKAGCQLWTEEQNLRLVSSWLKNSNDPVQGNSKKYEWYWKEVADEYNKHAPKEQRRTTTQCKNHWTKTIPLVNKFNGIYNEMKSTYASGQSEDQLMKKVRAKYMSVAKKKMPFPFEHWWRQVKDQPKWGTAYPLEEMHKRARLNGSGDYTSSTQDTNTPRPQGQKLAKAKRKGKGKGKSQCSEGSSFTDENLQLFNELQLRKSIVAEKMADATLVQAEAAKAQAEADKEMATTEKEKAKNEKLEKYLRLLDKDSSDFDEIA
ncbi:glutathione S-transferase T3-like [Phragmites australis]|uniref:glutathione S-transferase T3-like n=1 Tax=Phragmites australis TaxID=29695 RepID=UPI002D76AD85|nr:glutathione S-transferase T3-like [Phragmites australis]